LGGDNHKPGGAFGFRIEVRIISNRPLVLLGFSAQYCAPDGCYCWNADSTLRIEGKIRPTSTDLETLIEPVQTSSGFMHASYSRSILPPAPEQTPAECNYGDILITLKILNQGKEETVEYYFQFVPGGNLLPIEREREPPYLADSSLVNLRANALITDDDYVKLTTISARDRYRSLKFPRFCDALYLPTKSHFVITEEFRNFLGRIRSIELSAGRDPDDHKSE
jgi:hypothetical protein